MAHAPAQHASGQFDELDPHGYSHKGQHATHVIVGPFTLRTVLALLLFFTVLTVAQAQLEVYLSHALDIEFPRWVNVVFCMGIAVIKALLVMGYFMQLKYDNPINSVVMAFTFLGLGLFLGFTSLDLTGRGTVYQWKVANNEPGGTDLIVQNAADAAKKALGDAEFNRVKAVLSHEHAEHKAEVSGPQMSRGRTGLSGALNLTDPNQGEHAGHGGSPEAPATHESPAH